MIPLPSRASPVPHPASLPSSSCLFFFNDTATTEIYTLSLHDALPIYVRKTLPGIAGWPPNLNSADPRGFSQPDGRFQRGRPKRSTAANSSADRSSSLTFILHHQCETRANPFPVRRHAHQAEVYSLVTV